MPTETTVDKTLREVIGNSVTQTQEKSNVNNSEQTETGRKPEYVSGIDVSDMPDSLTKSEAKDWLAKKGKLIEDGYQVKFKEISEFKKERDAIVALGVTPARAAEIIRNAVKTTETKTEAKTEIKREIDSLKDEAPDVDTRRGVERLEKVIKELAPDSPAFKELQKEIAEIKKALGFVQNKTMQSRVESLNGSLDSLKGERFDGDFIEKYRDKVVELGRQYPEATTRELIKAASTADDYDDAILKTKETKQKTESRIKEKINANDSASSGVTGSEKKVDVQKVSLKGLIRQVMTQKR